MESKWLTKELFKEALEQGRVLVTGANKTSSGWTGYNVYIAEFKDDKFNLRYVCGHSYLWSNKKRYYHCTAWGTSRPLEIILDIGSHLGLTFNEIKQNHQVLI